MSPPSLSHLLHASNLPDTSQRQQLPRPESNRQPQPPTPAFGERLHFSHGPAVSAGHASLPSPGQLGQAAPALPSPRHHHPYAVVSLTSPPAIQPGAVTGPSAFAGIPASQEPGGSASAIGSASGRGPDAVTSAPPPPPQPPPPPLAHSVSNSHAPNSSASSPAKKSHANNTSLYQCADCQRRYSRPEHLARHIQTHTLGKRFGCQVCGKLFARADLLKRHALNHQPDNDNKKRRKTDPGAGRVSHACRPCATARVKCEELKPCTRCRNRRLNCEYASSEAGSVAATHLLHLSTAHSNAASTTSTADTNAANEQSSQESGAVAPPTADTAPPSAIFAAHDGIQGCYEPVQQHSHPPTTAHSQLNGSVQAQPYSHPQAHPTNSLSTYHTQHHGHHPRSQQPSSLPLHTSLHDGTPIATSHPHHSEESQLPTPDTVMDRNQEYNQQHNANDENVMDTTRLPFSDFLRDVLYEQSLDRAETEQLQGLAVLDFCEDTNLELNDVDFGLLDNWNLENFAPSAAHMQTPGAEEALDLSQMRQNFVQIWSSSPWRWDPANQDSGYREQGNLVVPTGSQFNTGQRFHRVLEEKLEPSGRDKILATVLSTVKMTSTLQRVASYFPSTEVFDALIHMFLSSHMCSVSEFIHLSSFKLNRQWPEWLGITAAAGAILTPVQTMRRLGYALQEAVRLTIPARFEDNNTCIRDLSAVQALVMVQDVGLWSGNKRKMEIAEAHLLIPITMMRYRGKFQRSKYAINVVEPGDEGEVLEQKWKNWYELESWKRLAFHAYLRDAQTSMTTLSNPSMSYSELTLPLPEARELWFAKTAQEWKAQHLARAAGHSKRPPSLGDLIRDITLLSQNHGRLDVQFSISIFLHGFWSLILEYRQLNAVHRTQFYSNSLSGNPSLLLTSRHQELCRSLHDFQAMTADWQMGNSSHGVMSAQEALVLNLLLMNLHVSLDDLQLFSGKEGEEQARRIYPLLQRWAEAPEARHALWSAGQIVRQAKMFPPGHLKDFYAVAVHHAALALWTFGVVTKATRRGQSPLPQHPHFDDTLYLDSTNSAAANRYINAGQGRVAIRGPTGGDRVPQEASIEDPKACMDVVQEVLRANFASQPENVPAIVENLCHLIKQLGNAAWAVGLG